eukprot:jgi/Mesen1/10449/ME000082S09956
MLRSSAGRERDLWLQLPGRKRLGKLVVPTDRQLYDISARVKELDPRLQDVPAFELGYHHGGMELSTATSLDALPPSIGTEKSPVQVLVPDREYKILKVLDPESGYVSRFKISKGFPLHELARSMHAVGFLAVGMAGVAAAVVVEYEWIEAHRYYLPVAGTRKALADTRQEWHSSLGVDTAEFYQILQTKGVLAYASFMNGEVVTHVHTVSYLPPSYDKEEDQFLLYGEDLVDGLAVVKRMDGFQQVLVILARPMVSRDKIDDHHGRSTRLATRADHGDPVLLGAMGMSQVTCHFKGIIIAAHYPRDAIEYSIEKGMVAVVFDGKDMIVVPPKVEMEPVRLDVVEDVTPAPAPTPPLQPGHKRTSSLSRMPSPMRTLSSSLARTNSIGQFTGPF